MGLLNAKKGQKAALTLHDFIDDCAAMGLEGTELTSYYFPAQPTGDYIRGLKSHAFRLGLDVSGTAIANDFCLPPGERRAAVLAHVKKWCAHAEQLSATVIRIFAGRIQKGQDEKEAHRLCVEGIQECCEVAGKHGVFLALENHGGITAEAHQILALVRDVQSPWFGVNMDTGNFHTADPYKDMEQLVPYALNVQVKVAIKGKDGKHQASDFKRIAKMLLDGGYRGYVVLEYEEKEDPRKACPRFVNELRDCVCLIP